ncbi:hypothetical protein EJ04DRAFT_493933 [Polyplosphaeria fusca]|uniref:Uncharacterized protein n=1 Tax=Polyplosphaeria fusca TaxID=682080 RepID=A0A9P4QZR9_9PLEO|nr:hypothetical protein EJ04DRAFT_493933 [Polyplosphaeria fusca]
MNPRSTDPAIFGARSLLCLEGWYDRQGKIQTRTGKTSFDSAVRWFDKEGEQDPNLRQSESISPTYRVISCPMSAKGPFSIGLPYVVWNEIERKFHLHPFTRSAIIDNNGVYSKFRSSSHETSRTEAIWILVKFPNSVNIGYDAVSVCYNANQKAVTVLYHGLKDEEAVFAALKTNGPLCFHPMFFLVAVYCLHQAQLSRYRTVVDGNIYQLEEEIGYAVPGRLERRDQKPVQRQDGQLIDYGTVVRRLQSFQTELASIGHVARFSKECGNFLLQSIEQLSNDTLTDSTPSFHEAREYILHKVEFSRGLTTSLLSQCQALKERVQSQSTLIFNLIAQDESRINREMAERTAEISVSSKKDSSAMKTIGLISAIFLPATFLSTFFGMDMFDWKPGSGSPKVSSYIWVYFAIAVPLTAGLAMSWSAWWKKEAAQYDLELGFPKVRRGSQALISKLD